MRIDELAESQRASAELLQDMGRQVEALARAHAGMVQTLRTAIGIASLLPSSQRPQS